MLPRIDETLPPELKTSLLGDASTGGQLGVDDRGTVVIQVAFGAPSCTGAVQLRARHSERLLRGVKAIDATSAFLELSECETQLVVWAEG